MRRSLKFLSSAAPGAAVAPTPSTGSMNSPMSGADQTSFELWTPTQRMYRELMQAIRAAHPGDRAALFWARHRIKVETYQYAAIAEDDRDLLVGVGKEVARFVNLHMKCDVERIQQHNRTMLRLPVPEAKRFRTQYLEKEAEHNSWCMQRIRHILERRPSPPYPYC